MMTQNRRTIAKKWTVHIHLPLIPFKPDSKLSMCVNMQRHDSLLTHTRAATSWQHHKLPPHQMCCWTKPGWTLPTIYLNPPPYLFYNLSDNLEDFLNRQPTIQSINQSIKSKSWIILFVFHKKSAAWRDFTNKFKHLQVKKWQYQHKASSKKLIASYSLLHRGNLTVVRMFNLLMKHTVPTINCLHGNYNQSCRKIHWAGRKTLRLTDTSWFLIWTRLHTWAQKTPTNTRKHVVITGSVQRYKKNNKATRES